MNINQRRPLGRSTLAAARANSSHSRLLTFLFLVSSLLVVLGDTIKLSISYSYLTGSSITISNVGTGYLEVQRSTDLINWTTFAIVNNPFPYTNSWIFGDYLSLSNPTAFYRATFIPGEPIITD